MRALVLNKQIGSLTKKKEKDLVTSYEGFLNSEYKQVAKSNFFDAEPDSIFGIKQRIKSRLYSKSVGIEVVLKLSLFAVVLAIIL